MCEKKLVIQVKKLVGLLPPHSNHLVVSFRLRRTFAGVITFIDVVALKFQFNF